jgi:hypothetical protein
MTDFLSRLRELVLEDRGDDLVDHLLLTGLIALVGIGTFVAMHAAMGNTYTTRETNINTLWTTPNPGAGS